MLQEDEISRALQPLTREQIKTLSKEEVSELLHLEQGIRLQLQQFYNEAMAANVELEQKRLFLKEKYVLLKNQFFARKSEKSEIAPKLHGTGKRKKARNKKCQKPSERRAFLLSQYCVVFATIPL